MTVVLLECREDNASENIVARLREMTRWRETGLVFDGLPVYESLDLKDVKLAGLTKMHITWEHVGERLSDALGKPEGIVFASRHRAASGKPALTVHPIGNPSSAEFGGLPNTLVPAMAAFQTECLRALRGEVERRKLPFEATFEATHHGPYTAVPSVFVEVGSTEGDWPNPTAGEAVASAILEALRRTRTGPAKPILACFGGSHYPARFTEFALQSDVHIGHMITEPHLEAPNVDAKVREAIAKTPGATHVYWHKKAIPKPAVEAVKRVAAELGLQVAEGQRAFPVVAAA